MQKWVGDVNTPIVSVYCLTYNHENFIEEALDSFLNQQTRFPFEIIIHDDASNDKTRNIIKQYEQKYPQIVKPILEDDNQYSKGGLDLVYRITNKYINGKYIAICEGDDLWIDNKKLQEQCDFLETHPQYGVCYSKAKIDQRLATFYQYPNLKEWGAMTTGFDDLLKTNKIPNCTPLIRFELHLKYLEDIKSEIKNGWTTEDYAEWLYLSTITKFHFFDKCYAAYRILPSSISNSNYIENEIKFVRGVNLIRWYFKQKYGSQVYVPSPNEHEHYYQVAINKAFDRLMTINKDLYYNSLGCIIFSNKVEENFRISIAFRIFKECGIKKILKKIMDIFRNKIKTSLHR